MDQRTHAWIAIRAIALLEDRGGANGLVKLLKPHATRAAVGAWLPDLADAKRGGSKTENHILKVLPYQGALGDRFVADKKEMLKRLGPNRLMSKLIRNDETLDDAWWKTPFKGDVNKPGQHLANRAMALSTMMLDLLIMGDKEIDKLLPGDVSFAGQLDSHARTQKQQAALYFFVLSHFVADACMPCHCDGRKLAGYSRGLHKEMEKHWSAKVGNTFEEDKLMMGKSSSNPDYILREARKVDERFDIEFKQGSVPDIKAGDVWLEVINICRGSFALASVMVSPSEYRYNDTKARVSFSGIFGENQDNKLEEIDRVVMHDSVLNTAMVWQRVWNKAAKE